MQSRFRSEGRLLPLAVAIAAIALLLPFSFPSAAQGKGNTQYQKVSFKDLKRYVPGKAVPPEIAALNGKNVEVLGFMAALTQLEDIDDFVLAAAPPLNCYCAPPLFINQVIQVQMRRPVSYKGGVVKVKGKLIINTKIRDEFTDVMYTIRADVME